MTMLEKVARAICLANTQGDEMWQAFVPEARAALEAMKEITPDMWDAIKVAPLTPPDQYLAGITAALEGK